MLKIRLRRVGAKKQPSYRVVVADSRSPRSGRFVETVGFYNPRTEPPTVELEEDRIRYWMSQGAQPTEAVRRLLEQKERAAEQPEAVEPAPEPEEEGEEAPQAEAGPEEEPEEEAPEAEAEARPEEEAPEDEKDEPSG